MNLHEIYMASQLAVKNGGGNVDLSDYYTKSQTDSQIASKVAEIVADAPEDFDTLKELSDWINEHEDSAAAMNSAIVANTTAIVQKADKSTTYTKTETDNLLAGKVDKIAGKGLSTNDFTNADKSRLDGLENYDDTEVKEKTTEMVEQTALNRSTLGYQRKNLLMNNCKNTTKNGVTATVNADSSITFTGSNTGGEFVIYWNMQTGNASSNYPGNKKWLPDGKYIVSGGHVGVTVQVRWSENNESDAGLAASANGREPVFNVTDTHKYVWSRILVGTNADFSTPVTVYPMIRLAEITDDTYEPYRPSVAEYIASLEERISALESVNLTANSINSSLNTAEINTTEEDFDND